MKTIILTLTTLLALPAFGAEVVLQQKAVCMAPNGQEAGLSITHYDSVQGLTISAYVFSEEALRRYKNGTELLDLPLQSGEADYNPSSIDAIDVNFGGQTVRYQNCRELRVWNLLSDWNDLLTAWQN